MADLTNDDENETERKKRTEGETGTGSASGFVRASGDGMVRSSQVDADEIEAKRKKRGEGDSESGSVSTGTGFVRASGEGIVRLTVEQTKKVWADFRHLDLNEVVAAVAEFFSEFPARASANLSVVWGKGSFAIINMAIKFGQDVATAVRERTRESAVQVRRRYGLNIKVRRNGVTVSIPNPQAGLS
jgi:hypothetical protein